MCMPVLVRMLLHRVKNLLLKVLRGFAQQFNNILKLYHNKSALLHKIKKIKAFEHKKYEMKTDKPTSCNEITLLNSGKLSSN